MVLAGVLEHRFEDFVVYLQLYSILLLKVKTLNILVVQVNEPDLREALHYDFSQNVVISLSLVRIHTHLL